MLASGIALIAFMTLLAWGVEKLIWSHDRNLARPLKLFGVALVAMLLCVGGSQLTTYTPRIAGDNAIVIGMAARNLPAHLQKKAIFWGPAGAIILSSSMIWFQMLIH